jgi:hypothetical protein
MVNRIGLLALAGVALTSAATAQTATTVPPAVLAFTATPDHVAALMGAVRPYFGQLPSCIQGTAKRIGLDVVAPVSVDASGALSGGAWVEHIKVDGCTTSGLFNVFTQIQPGTTPLVGGLLPGTTRAPLGLQRDALPTVRQLATSKLPQGCNDIYVVDTRFAAFGEVVNKDVPPGREARSWREDWTFIGCGQPASVTVRFIPDRTGTSFTAEH